MLSAAYPNRKGVLITFEGIEGVGKTTQTQLFCEKLKRNGIPCLLTREPGGTDLGERIRDCLLGEYDRPLDARTELLLLIASRFHHCQSVVIPALNEGKIVVIDRFIDATLAYQGYGRNVDLSLINELHSKLGILMKPDLTFLIDLSIEESRERIETRGFFDRIEKEKDAFFTRVRDGYLKLQQEEPERMIVISGNLPRLDLCDHIYQIFESFFHVRD